MQILSADARRPIAVEGTPPRTGARAPLEAWSALATIGGAFFILGLIDIGLGWYPAAFGNLEWEFGTISGTLNALAIPMLGLYLMLGSAIARSDRRMARMVSGLMGLLLATLVVLGIIYLTVVPVAMKSVADNALISLGMKKGVVKALTLGLADCALLITGIVKGLRVPRLG
jgi:hypothetical protein